MAAETPVHLIFFIAATLMAAVAAGGLITVIDDLSTKTTMRGKAFAHQLVSEITIVNDPNKVVSTGGTTTFYVRNTGQTILSKDTVVLLLDGTIVTTTNTLLGGETTFRPAATIKLEYAANLGSGDHLVRAVAENGVYDEMKFRI